MRVTTSSCDATHVGDGNVAIDVMSSWPVMALGAQAVGATAAPFQHSDRQISVNHSPGACQLSTVELPWRSR